MNLKDNVALVTGASRGIGRAIAEKLASEGANLVITATTDAIKERAKEIADKYGVKVIGVAGNIANEDDVKALFKLITDEFGGLDICVNNAGISKDSLTMRTSFEDFKNVVDINLNSVFLVSKEAMLLMMRKKYGRVINISSIVGVTGNVGQPSYAASKAGIIGLTKTMASEVASRKITVNAVAPGFISTDMTDSISDKAKEHYLNKIPMKKYGEVEDIADAVCFLAQPTTKYITGQVLIVDGGLSLG